MTKLAWAMCQFDSRLDYRKVLSFLTRRAEAGDKIYFDQISTMCYLYWHEV